MYKIHKLKNGLPLVYRSLPSKSAAIGLWIKSGSIYESEMESGASHFIEHMLFKGTKSRTARQISEEMDFVGGQINAYTCRDYTCFHTKTLGDSLRLSLDILSDMYFNSVFDESELEQERRVIIEEINMYEDSPEDVIHDLAAAKQWGGSFGRSITGSVRAVENLSRGALLSWFDRMYAPENTVLSVAGCFSEAELISAAEEFFGSRRKAFTPFADPIPRFTGGREEKHSDIEQTHICIGFEGYDAKNSGALSLAAVGEILGGGMSSRLVQEMREKRGLCYNVYSYSDFFMTGGAFGVYTAVSPEKAAEAEDLMLNILYRFKEEGPTDYEIEKVKSQLRCSCIMSSEAPSSVMRSMGRDMLLRKKPRTGGELLGEIAALSKESLWSAAREVLSREPVTVILSPED